MFQPLFNKAHQRGVAIITALLIMAIVAVISVSLTRHLQIDIRRTGNIIASEQGIMYISGAEELAKFGLKLDHDNSDTDDNNEQWAQPVSFPFQGGTLTGRIRGLQGCFNINDLTNGNAVNKVAKQRFQRLLSSQGLNPQLADAVIDWIDPNLDVTLPDGAEDGYYTNLPHPYRTANQPMQSLSELRLVKGFNVAPANNTGNNSNTNAGTVYDRIAPYLCAFGQRASININTAPAEVLISLAPDLTMDQAKAIVANRFDPTSGSTDYKSVKDMITRNKLSKYNISTEGLSVTTDYFMLDTIVAFGELQNPVIKSPSTTRVEMYSLLYRDPNSGNTSVLRHSIGTY